MEQVAVMVVARAEPVDTARACSKHLIGINLFGCPSNPMRQKYHSPYVPGGETEAQRDSNNTPNYTAG